MGHCPKASAAESHKGLVTPSGAEDRCGVLAGTQHVPGESPQGSPR